MSTTSAESNAATPSSTLTSGLRNEHTKRLLRLTRVRPPLRLPRTGTPHYRLPKLEANGGGLELDRYNGPAIPNSNSGSKRDSPVRLMPDRRHDQKYFPRRAVTLDELRRLRRHLAPHRSSENPGHPGLRSRSQHRGQPTHRAAGSGDEVRVLAGYGDKRSPAVINEPGLACFASLEPKLERRAPRTRSGSLGLASTDHRRRA